MKTFMLSKPEGNSPIPLGIQSFVSEKLKNDCYDLVMRAFKDSGLTQVELAARLGKDKTLLSRQLSTPSNWTIDTVGRLLFAINGSFIVVSSAESDMSARANYTCPSWMDIGLPSMSGTGDGRKSIVMTFAPAPTNVQTQNGIIGAQPQAMQETPNYRTAAE